MPGPGTLAALCLAVTLTLAERGLQGAALQAIVEKPRQLARLLIAALLPGTLAAALLAGWMADLPLALVAAAGFFVAVGACLWLLRQHALPSLQAALPWLLVMLAMLFCALAAMLGALGQSTRLWLAGGLMLSIVLGLGLPAFALLAQRFDGNPALPGFMRAMPVRVLLMCVCALGLAGSLSW